MTMCPKCSRELSGLVVCREKDCPVETSGNAAFVMSTNASSIRTLAHVIGDSSFPVEAPVEDVVQRAPDITGERGKAWRVDIAELIRQNNANPDDYAHIASWVVEAPWAHPVWHSYEVGLIHLRPLATTKDRKVTFHLDGATHEVFVFALDPKGERERYIKGHAKNSLWLHPGNFSAQIIEVRDELAIERVRHAVQEICDGKLSPDADYIHHWAKRFGDNMIKKADRRA